MAQGGGVPGDAVGGVCAAEHDNAVGELQDGVAGQRREKARAVAEGDDFGGDSVFGELPLAQFGPRCGVV